MALLAVSAFDPKRTLWVPTLAIACFKTQACRVGAYEGRIFRLDERGPESQWGSRECV